MFCAILLYMRKAKIMRKNQSTDLSSKRLVACLEKHVKEQIITLHNWLRYTGKLNN